MTHITVHDTERAVVRVRTVLGAGRHRLPRVGRLPLPRRAGRALAVQRVDVRQRVLLVAGQELATSDPPGVRVTAAFRLRVADPVAFLHVAVNPFDDVRLAAQVAMRDALARRTFEELTPQRPQLAAELATAVEGPARAVGLELLDADLRDVSPPGEVRRALLGLLTARTEGLAALERARGETAALRALAKGARVLADHPGLLQLRTAQVVAEGGGTVVLRGDRDGASPDPVG